MLVLAPIKLFKQTKCAQALFAVLMALVPSKKCKTDDEEETTSTSSIQQRNVKGRVIISMFTEEGIKDLQGRLDGNTHVRIILHSHSSLLTLMQAMDNQIKRPVDKFSLPILTFANFNRWHEAISELGSAFELFQSFRLYYPPSLLDNCLINWLMTNSITNRPTSSNSQAKKVKTTKLQLIPIGSISADPQHDYFLQLHHYLLRAAQRSDQGDRPNDNFMKPTRNFGRKRNHGVLTDLDVIKHEDVVRVLSVVSGILSKVGEAGIKGMVAMNFLQQAHCSDVEINSILKIRTAGVIINDLYHHGEIDYGLHWLRDWFPVWYVEKWDSSWSNKELFSGEKAIFCRKYTQGSAIKELQAVYRMHYKELTARLDDIETSKRKSRTWNEFITSSFYYM